MWPLDGISTLGISGFFVLWAVSYAVHLALYFGLGSLLLWVNQYFPERQIPAISGRERKARRTPGAEIRQSLKSLIGTSFCLAARRLCANNRMDADAARPVPYQCSMDLRRSAHLA